MSLPTYQSTGTCYECEQASAYYVGIWESTTGEQLITGESCLQHVDQALTNIGQQAFGTYFWPMVASLDKDMIYNAHEYDALGLSHAVGWEAYRAAKGL